jgi:hypothetical protein
LTAKNVWDFEQMTQRAITPTLQQRRATLALIGEILATAERLRR